MTNQLHDLVTKTAELEEALRQAGLWQHNTPGWVHWYSAEVNIATINFGEWLQFIFIPNHLHNNKMMVAAEKTLIVPHAIKYFGDDVQRGRLLEILIEIDALL